MFDSYADMKSQTQIKTQKINFFVEQSKFLVQGKLQAGVYGLESWQMKILQRGYKFTDLPLIFHERCHLNHDFFVQVSFILSSSLQIKKGIASVCKILCLNVLIIKKNHHCFHHNDLSRAGLVGLANLHLARVHPSCALCWARARSRRAHDRLHECLFSLSISFVITIRRYSQNAHWTKNLVSLILRRLIHIVLVNSQDISGIGGAFSSSFVLQPLGIPYNCLMLHARQACMLDLHTGGQASRFPYIHINPNVNSYSSNSWNSSAIRTSHRSILREKKRVLNRSLVN